MTTAGAIALGVAIGAVAVGIAWVVVALRCRGGGADLAKVIKLQADRAREAEAKSNIDAAKNAIAQGDKEIDDANSGDGPSLNELAGFEPPTRTP